MKKENEKQTRLTLFPRRKKPKRSKSKPSSKEAQPGTNELVPLTPSISLKLLRARSTERGPSLPDTTLARGRSLVVTQEGQSKPQELDGPRWTAGAARSHAAAPRPAAWEQWWPALRRPGLRPAWGPGSIRPATAACRPGSEPPEGASGQVPPRESPAASRSSNLART